MKTKLNTLGAMLLCLLLCCCNHKEVRTFCDQYANVDSLREELIVRFDVNSYYAIACCCPDSDMAMYAILLADSAPGFVLSSDLYDATNVNDMVKLYYLSREFAKNDYFACSELLNFMQFENDSVYSLLSAESYPIMMTKTANESTLQSALIDSLCQQVRQTCDYNAYTQLRTSLGARQLASISLDFAEATHNPVACYDAYLCYIGGYATTVGVEQQHMLSILLASSNQHYAPASFLLANMYLSGESMPRDTAQGKLLLSELGIVPREPFWRYSPTPLVYQHLLDERARIIAKRAEEDK